MSAHSEATKYGGFWIRLWAYLIDSLVLLIPTVIFEIAAQELSPWWYVPNLAMWLLYTALLHSSSWQATVGKRAVGLIVVDEQGGRISFERALKRFLAEVLSALILCIGYLMIGWTRHKRGLHDIMARTYVIRGTPGVVVAVGHGAGGQGYAGDGDQGGASRTLAKAEQGDVRAQFQVGLMYRDGQGFPQDYLQAYQWLNLAAAGGDRDARYTRDLLIEKLSPGQVNEGQRLSRERWDKGSRKRSL